MSDENPTLNQAGADAGDKHSALEHNLKSRDTWLRLVFILVYCLIVSIATLVGSFIVGVGFIWVLVTGEVNRQLQQVGQSLASYVYQVVRYLTFNSDQKPFPFGADWPSAAADQ